MQVKGRHWILLWLVLFLVVATAVIARGSSAYSISRELTALRVERASLEAQRAELERRIRQASSRQTLIERMRRAGLHSVSDSEYILFPVPSGYGRAPR